ncbi:hypothetical protein F5148DRAFT_956715, partial [Russula earlei]
TFDMAGYGPVYRPHQDVVDFCDAVVHAFKPFPTYDILASAGIVSCNPRTYQFEDIRNALEAQTARHPCVCRGNNSTVFQEVWYCNHDVG